MVQSRDCPLNFKVLTLPLNFYNTKWTTWSLKREGCELWTLHTYLLCRDNIVSKLQCIEITLCWNYISRPKMLESGAVFYKDVSLYSCVLRVRKKSKLASSPGLVLAHIWLFVYTIANPCLIGQFIHFIFHYHKWYYLHSPA